MGKKRIAVVDGNSLMHRAFHALPITLTGSDGRPTNAVYGFLTMLFRLVEDVGPDSVIVAFDKGKPQFRLDVLEKYKVHRPPTAPELKDQFPMVKRVLEALRVPVVELDGWEGDDILGTVAERAKQEGYEVLLITGDKDAMQLVDEDVKVVSSRKRIGDLVYYGPAEVEERFGVTPAQIPDFLGLKGDSSDNIPGVPGVGEKTAAKWLQQYGTLEGLLEHADEIGGKIGEKLREHAQDALDSREVATIRRDAPVEFDLDEAPWGGWDAAEVLSVFKDLRMASLVGKVVEGGLEGAAVADPGEPLPLKSGAEAKRHVQDATVADGDWVGVATGEQSSDTLVPREEVAVCIGGAVAVLDADDAAGLLGEVLRRHHVSSPDTKGLLHRVTDDVDAGRLFDVVVAAYLLDSTASSYDIQALRSQYLGRPLGSDGGDRLAADAQASAELVRPLREALEDAGCLECFERIEMPLVPVLARMEKVGIAVAKERLSVLAAELEDQIASLTAEIHELAGTEFNIDSPKQLAHVLFEKLQLPTGKRTKTGFSTDSSVLAPLATVHPIAARVLEYREVAKLKSTYVDALPRLLGEDGRLHTTFNQTVAATGRLSSSNPNLQNIPARTALGRRIRSAFVPGEGFDLLMSADYSQIELRLLAHLSGDPDLIAAFVDGRDFHASTAARLFGVALEDVTPEMRDRAKATNFGIVYGISAHGLSQQLGIDHAEAQEMIDRYFKAYPKVREYLDGLVGEARRTGFATTMFGRRRPIPELASRNHNLRGFGERTAMNHPLQGSAADIIKLAMVAVDSRLRSEGLTSRLVLQVHDELVFEVTSDEEEAVASLAREEMTRPVELDVPLVVHVSSGVDWAAAK
ncbi:MAG: DNA polymerase I [Coriobacteriia bacterium]